MFREILHLGPIHIYSYGFMQFLAFLGAILLAVKRCKRYQVDKNVIFDLAFWILIAGILGARFWYVIEHFDLYKNNPASIFYIWEGGLVIYGGLLLGFIAGWYYLNKHKLSFWTIADLVAPSITLGIFIGRIGCFLNGCCYGIPSEKLGIVFTDHSSCQLPPEAPVGTAVIPTQIYSSVSALFLTLFLLLVDRRKNQHGQTFSWLLIFYSIHRLAIDFLRHYEGKAVILKFLTLSQTLSVVLLIAGLITLWVRTRKAPAEN
ncbi:MAG: hypothetical protein APR63_13285 [Desulfuromonas sp. SDB]|nr:MAG: hypothetical protein APR63_13285 [Desulfuromonas sp. SDB]